ncbi:hypothetical protein RUND412_001170 [Rhizina undulata]
MDNPEATSGLQPPPFQTNANAKTPLEKALEQLQAPLQHALDYHRLPDLLQRSAAENFQSLSQNPINAILPENPDLKMARQSLERADHYAENAARALSAAVGRFRDVLACASYFGREFRDLLFTLARRLTDPTAFFNSGSENGLCGSFPHLRELYKAGCGLWDGLGGLMGKCEVSGILDREDDPGFLELMVAFVEILLRAMKCVRVLKELVLRGVEEEDMVALRTVGIVAEVWGGWERMLNL